MDRGSILIEHYNGEKHGNVNIILQSDKCYKYSVLSLVANFHSVFSLLSLVLLRAPRRSGQVPSAEFTVKDQASLLFLPCSGGNKIRTGNHG